MDAELERLARAAASGEHEAVRRHETALLRAGRRDEVEARYWAKFVCPTPWEELRTVDPRELLCSRCGRVELASALSTRQPLGPRVLERLRTGIGVAIDGSLPVLGSSIDALMAAGTFDGGPAPPSARVHLAEYLEELSPAQHYLPEFLAAHPAVTAALRGARVEVVPFGFFGSGGEPDDVRRWWPHLLELLSRRVEAGCRAVVLLEGPFRLIDEPGIRNLDLPDLAGWLVVGTGGARFLGPDGEEVDDIEAHVLEWCRWLEG